MSPHLVYVCEDRGIPLDGNKGSSIHVRSMLAAFAGANARLTVCSPRIGETSWAHGLDIRFVCLEPGHDLTKDSLELLQMLDLIHSDDPIDGIYERLSLFACEASRWCRRRNVPHCVEVNAPLAWEAARHRNCDRQEWAQTIEREVLLNAHALFPVSPWLAEWLSGLGCSWAQIFQIPNGIPQSWLRPRKCAMENRSHHKIVLGFVGSLRPWHDVPTLIKSMALLPADDFELTIIGDGPMRSEWHAFAQSLHLEDRIQWTGALPHHEMPRTIDQLDICVAPYSADSDCYFCPIKIFEYGARQKPVLAADIPDLRRQFPADGMLYYRPGDYAHLAEMIQEAIQNPAWPHRAAYQLRRYVEQHTWDEHARHILEHMAVLRCQPRVEQIS